MMTFLKSQHLILRRAVSAALAILFAIVVDHFYSFAHAGWVPLTAFLVLQITSPMNLQNAMQRFLIVLGGVLVAMLMYFQLNASIWLDIIVVIVFTLGFYFQGLTAGRRNSLSYPLMLGILFLLLLTPFNGEQVIFPRLHDVVMGGLLAVIFALLVFPRRADVDFRTSVAPVLKACGEYLLAVSQLFCRVEGAGVIADQKKIRVENTLQTQRAMFPDWVYAAGFNPVMQPGHRHFLIRIEQLGQILFAMHYVARHAVDDALLESFREPVRRCVDEAEKLISAMLARLELRALETTVAADFSDDIVALEKVFRETIQVPLELLDLSLDHTSVAAFIYDLKDLQKNLLKLAEALR
jgi:hypothetical protein